jgi:signal transduction histidine kinase
MNAAVLIASASALIAAYVALLSRRFSVAPGWLDQRWFSIAALTVAAFACLDVSTTLPLPDALVIWCARVQMILAGLYIYAWIRYSDLHLGGRANRVRAALEKLPLVIGALGLVPGVTFVDAIRTHSFAPLGVTYRDVVTTPFGSAGLALQTLFLAWVAYRYAVAWRRGVGYAGLHFLALLFLNLIVVNDVLVAAGALQNPYLIDIGFVVPIAAVGYALTGRFAEDAGALAELRDRLEALVEERTRELARAQERALSSEKLAALGRFAARVAHGVNSPAAAAVASLRYLAGTRPADGPGAWSAEAEECLADATSAVDRITRIMQGLRDAGRLAEAPGALERVRLSLLVHESVRAALKRCGDRIPVVAEVPEEFQVLAQAEPLIHVLTSLIVNGLEAIPGDRVDGRVLVRCRRLEAGLQLTVEDNGAGIPRDVLQHAFEPFFSTKPFGTAGGLGLAVSRVLVQSLGGDLRLESAVGRGTSVLMDLPDAPARPAWPAEPGARR